MLFALFAGLALDGQVLLDSVHHVFDQLEDLLFRGFARPPLCAHRLRNGFGLFDDSFDEESVLLLAFVGRSLVAVLELGEVGFELGLQQADLLSPFL